MSLAVYPGSFDPITLGHLDVVQRAAGVFDRVIVAVAQNISKQTLFDFNERVALAQDALASLSNVAVEGVDGLLVDFASRHQAQVILRGLRAVSDYEYEFQLAGMNRHLNSRVETLFMPTAKEYTHISSSLVKEVARFGGDVSAFLTPGTLAALNQKLGR